MPQTRWLAILLTLLTLASPAYPTATTFDGSDDIVTIPFFVGFGMLDFPGYSLGCWTYRTGDGAGSGGRIMSAEDTTFYLRDSPPSTTEGFFHPWTSGGAEWTFPRPSANAWHHIAVTYDGSSSGNDPIIYVDGASVTVTEISAPSGSIVLTTSNVIIGNRTGADRGWVGHLASCFYYESIILTAGQIRQVMWRGPQTLITAYLQCYWPLGVFGGRSVAGDGRSSCHGTVSGSPGTTSIGPPVSIPQGAPR